jgi:hypothetical protein
MYHIILCRKVRNQKLNEDKDFGIEGMLYTYDDG